MFEQKFKKQFFWVQLYIKLNLVLSHFWWFMVEGVGSGVKKKPKIAQNDLKHILVS